MKYLLAIFGIVTFSSFVWAVKYHFQSDVMPVGMRAVSILSFTAFITFCFLVMNNSIDLFVQLISAILMLISLSLFLYSVRTTKSDSLALAFDSCLPVKVYAGGVYAWIRHPFYTSYIIFWTAAVVATTSYVMAAFWLALLISYVVAALIEEKRFLCSALKGEYQAYLETTGMFLPRIVR